ncbi:MAG: 4-hydroxy-3-methylbut-2-enyl diphosphate reductase [Spirochaetaceae bacterium]|jgi:4-hydroxy-3-methylbut-2-enyl diphosphate reductase|nr:4-hydroxy-3-methylbut-2-enyl diphosphate reductase [Spirochaetaceae bacterium]
MKVLRAKVLGFCMGVRRAMNMAGSEARLLGDLACSKQIDGSPPHAAEHSGPPARDPSSIPPLSQPKIFTIGPLIHNPQALKTLSEQGISVLEEDALPPCLTGAVLIVRAHGITPGLEETLKERGGRLVDATCPHVRSSQTRARQLAEAGYHIFLAGEKRHGEIIGIQGYAEQGQKALLESGRMPEASGGGDAAPGLPCTIVADAAEAEEAARLLHEKNSGLSCALLAQTTMSPEEYKKTGDAILKYFPSLRIVDTICGATRDRQEALRELCAAVEAVIIAGGRESANTRRLLAIARNSGVPAWLAETQADLPKEIWNYSVVGLSAGASTPDSIIRDIERALTGSQDAV